MLIPVQQAQIAKYALASGNKAAIVLRYMKVFQTKINYNMSSVSMRHRHACGKQNMCQN